MVTTDDYGKSRANNKLLCKEKSKKKRGSERNRKMQLKKENLKNDIFKICN